MSVTKKKILVLGTSGMAGHVIFKYLSDLDKYQMIGVARNSDQTEVYQMDVSNFEDLENLIHKIKPYFIVNAIGILIKGSKNSLSNAILINSYFPHFLESICKNTSTKLIHISTDCVFSGNDDGGYKENSFRDADDIYGRSKALGEVVNDVCVTIRTSIIGQELKNVGEGLFHWFMNQKGTINGFSDVYWSGVTTLELAKGVELTINNNITGLFHLTNSKKISKYHLLKLFKKVWQKEDVIVNEAFGKPKDKSFINTRYKEFDLKCDYEQMLVEMKVFMIKNNSFFNYNERYKI